MSENGIPTIKFRVRTASTVVSPVDTTLSVEGMAADAKAVGDALALKAAVADLTAEHITHGTETVADEIDALEAAVALKLDADDVADNLTTDDPAKALSAAQGVAIAAALDQKLDGSGLANDLTTTAEGLALDARQGPAIKALIDALADAVALKLSASDVVDNMTTADATKALSANQGVALATMGQQLLELVQARISYDDLANNLTTDRAGLALDARQGAALKALIDALTTEVAGKLSPSDVVNTLTDSSPDSPLSALQGSLLKSLIDDLTVVVGDKLSAADLVNDLDTTTAGKALDARQGRAIRLLLDAKLDADDIADDLETTATGKALDARQGNVLATTKLDKTDVVDDLQTPSSNQALSAKQGKALNDRLAVRETELDNGVMHFDDLVTNPDATSGGKPLDASAVVGLDTEIGLKLDKQNVLNSLEVTSAGYALDARAGKTVNDKIDNLIDMTVFGSYASVDDAVADIWDGMENGSFRMGRVAIEGVATFMFMAYRHGTNYASALLFSYGGDLRQYNKVNGAISGYRFTHQ